MTARKLTDEQVRSMRRHFAAADPKPSFDVLGELFGVCGKTAWLVVTGRSRPEAGGPITREWCPARVADHPRRKLTDEQIREMRELYASAPIKPSWHVLGELFGVGSKSAYRYCVGLQRAKAGGPIAPPPSTVEPERYPHHNRKPKRCRGCGGMVFLPCKLCDLRAKIRAGEV